MKRTIIYTTKYKDEVERFASKAVAAEVITIKWSGNRGRTYGLGCLWAGGHEGSEFYERLLSLLMEVAEKENPIYRHSPKLRDLAKDLRRTDIYKKELRQLKGFLSGSGTLHLEGYVTFRMSEYREKLDMMVYSLVKKLRLENKI